MDDLLSGTSAGDVARGPGEKVPAGHYPKLRLLKCEVFRAQTGRKARCFKVVSEVAEAANGKEVGDRLEQFCQLEFNTHEYYDKDSRAQVMQFLGALYGYGTVAEIDAHISTKQLEEVSGPAQPKTGTLYAADVSYKKPDSIFAKWQCRPVNGAAQPAAQAAPATPAAAPAAAPAVPPGWRVHPVDSRFIFNEANPADMKQIA
jgi:hypothetical protein